jgi:hypothetical protein
VILGLSTVAIRSFQSQLPQDALIWLRESSLWLLIGWVRPWRDWVHLRRHRIRHHYRRSVNWMSLIPVLLGLVFLGLFSLANPVLGRWLAHLDWHVLKEAFNPGRLLFFLISLWTLWALIRPYRLKRHAAPSTDILPPGVSLLSPTLCRNSLIAFNLLFLLQTGMDALYLWGGIQLPEGLTYAEYAHRGAYPLIVTALLAGGFVFIALRPGSATSRAPGIRWLVTAWILQNAFLTVSAIQRTLLYVAVYSLSHWRIAALIWMGLVALGLFWMLWRIWRQKSDRWLINANALSLLVVLYTCSCIDFDNMIAWYNVRHSQEVTGQGQALDFDYLEAQIGPSAIPALAWYQRHAAPKSPGIWQAMALRTRLREALTTRMQDWHAWTWRDQQVLEATRSLPAVNPLQSTGWLPEGGHE